MTQPAQEHQRQSESDAALLARIAEGEEVAFAQLVQRHARRFYRLAFRFMQSRAEAEDMVQDALMKLWAEPTLWRAERNVAFTTWFSRVIINRCLDARRKKPSAPLSLAMDVADGERSAESALIDTQQQRLLEMHIAQLPERQRTAINLCFGDGISNQQAAEIMQIPLKALQSLLMRAKATLKQQLTDGDHHG